MKKKLATLVLLSLISLASCNPRDTAKSDSTSPSSNTAKPSVSTTNSTTGSPSTSKPKVDPPSIDEEDFSYLIGTYYTKGSSLSLSKDSLKIQGEKELNLVPTAVSEATMGEGEEAYETKVVEFSKDFNGGIEYQAYINFQDGLLHVENLSENHDSTIGTYMPDIKSYSGTYSAYGDSNERNVYISFDGHFDLERGVFPESHRMMKTFSDEQTWYIKSFYTMVNDIPYIGIQEYDQDDYGYGKELLVRDQTNNKIYIIEGTTSADVEYYSYVTDIGGYQGLPLFDGVDSFETSLDTETKQFTFGKLSSTYEEVLDQDGFHLKATLDGKDYLFSIGEYHVIAKAGENTLYYPVDNISSLYGEFKTKDETFKIEENEEGLYPNVYVNGTKIENVSYTIKNKRKAICFVKDNKTYYLSADKTGSAIRLDKDQEVLYPLNEVLFAPIYTDSFLYKEKGQSLTLEVKEDLSYQIGEEKGNADLVYTHGDKYPNLSLTYTGKNYSLSLVQQSAGYYVLKGEDKTYTLYSKTILDKVYGTYSADGIKDFVFSEEKLVKDGKDHSYSFTPYLNTGDGTYSFAITLDEDKTLYQNNLHGTFYSSNESYVKKELFTSLYGTYSGYGKYGIENIKFTKEGKLYLDSLNEDKTGLIKDVNYSYNIMTNTSDEIGIAFKYSDELSLLILFHGTYVSIGNLNYYREELVQSWGTYVDDDDILYFQDDKLYLNGTSLYISDTDIKNGSVIMKTASYTFTFDKNGKVTKEDNQGERKTLNRKLSYSDFEKFEGTYTINGETVTFKKSDQLGYSFIITSTFGDTSYNYYIARHNGKISLVGSSISANYYLMLDEDTGEITTDYSSSVPLPPPPPAI